MNFEQFIRLQGETPDYASMTHEELLAFNQHLWQMRQQLKAEQMVLQPYLDVAEAAASAAAAAKADPALTQSFGWPISPEVAAKFPEEGNG